MNLSVSEKIFSQIYPVIKDLFDERFVVDRPAANVIELDRVVGQHVDQRLKEHFVPSFFHDNLYCKTSLLGCISICLFSLVQKFDLDHYFECFNQNLKLFSVILKAERCWLGSLLDDYEMRLKSPTFIAQHLTHVVTSKNEAVDLEEIQRRLNEMVALTDVFYRKHGKGHNFVTNRVPHTYFRRIFGNL